MVACQAHNLKVVGSNPTPAIMTAFLRISVLFLSTVYLLSPFFVLINLWRIIFYLLFWLDNIMVMYEIANLIMMVQFRL